MDKFLKRNLPIYTYLDSIEDVKEAQQLFLAECETRKIANRLIDSFKIDYIDKELEFLFELDKSLQNDEFNDFIITLEQTYKDKINDNMINFKEDKYLLLILAGFSFRYLDKQYNHLQDIIDIDFYMDVKEELYTKISDIKTLDFIYNEIEVNHKINFEVFIGLLRGAKDYSEDIEKLITMKKEQFIKYRLIHTTKYKSYKEAPYIQIDLTLKDEEIMKQIIEIKQLYKDDISYFELLNKKKPRAITKAIEYSNILYTYDCRKLNYEVSYIEQSILYYCEDINYDFKISNNKYKEYLTTAKKHIDL